jgi:hypothetical protein
MGLAISEMASADKVATRVGKVLTVAYLFNLDTPT